MDKLQRDPTTSLTPGSSPDAPTHMDLRRWCPLYPTTALRFLRPYDVSAKVLDIATQLLKRAGEHDVKVAGTGVEVAWTLIASLMSLGPNFV
jgi:hypothetical protein